MTAITPAPSDQTPIPHKGAPPATRANRPRKARPRPRSGPSSFVFPSSSTRATNPRGAKGARILRRRSVRYPWELRGSERRVRSDLAKPR